MKDLQNACIFVVDDDPFYLHVVAQELKQRNFKNIHLFNDGDECINNLYMKPDVIILDYRMDNLNGLEVLKKVKLFSPQIIVIFLTAQKQLKVAVDSMKFGAYDYIEKGDAAAKEITEKIYSAWEVIHQIN